MPLYPFIVLEVGSAFRVPIPQLYIGEPSSGFTPGLGSASVGCHHRSLVALNEFGTFVEDTLQKALKFYENKLPKQ
jgi:hypothetical protein